MEKLSQLNLIEEGFLDAIRLAGKAARGTVRFANELDTQGFKALVPIKPINKFLDSETITDPKKFVLSELKTTYYRTFNTKSIKNLEVKKDTTGQQNVQYLPKVTKSTNRFIVSFDAMRFKPSGGTDPSQTYYAYVVRGGQENKLSMDVRDVNGNQIQGEKSTTPEKPTLTSVIAKYRSKQIVITVAVLSTIITRDLGISERDYASKLSQTATDMDMAIMDITNKTSVTDVLDQADIDLVNQTLKARQLTEKTNVSQKVLIEQLKSLS